MSERSPAGQMFTAVKYAIRRLFRTRRGFHFRHLRVRAKGAGHTAEIISDSYL